MKRHTKERERLVFIIFLVICLSLIPMSEGIPAEEVSIPEWEIPTKPVPTIEELTDGKAKVGDTITKENVDLVKDLLLASTYELVRQGMVLSIGKGPTPGELIPDFYRKATEESYKTVGRPIVGEDGIVWTKDGKTWPGGLPFPHPKTEMEVVANAKYGEGINDYFVYGKALFVNKNGEQYKAMDTTVNFLWLTCRELPPHKEKIPGYEREYLRSLNLITSPRDLRGLGQLTTRYYDDVKNADSGFAYIPAFKRTIRISATTWQDSVAGADMTYGDTEGLREPFSYWNFKIIAEKPMLMSVPKKETYSIPRAVGNDFDLDSSYFYGGTGGRRFLKDTYEVTPLYVIEATPKIKHIYGKKILYTYTPGNWALQVPITGLDNYDRAGQLWKGMIEIRHTPKCRGIDQYHNSHQGMLFFDLQTGHQTIIFGWHDPNYGFEPADFDLKTLIAAGR